MLDMNTQMRLTGLATGLDTDAMIQNLGRVHTLRIDSVKRDRQLALWRQDTFRNTINIINNFVRSNLNVANPASNFRSSAAFAKFTYNVSMNGIQTEEMKAKAAGVVSVTANGDIKNFNQSIQSVAQLASKDTWSGEKMGLQGIKTDGINLEGFMGYFLTQENPGDPPGVATGVATALRFNISIDGVSRTITMTDDVKKIFDENGPKYGNATLSEEVFATLDELENSTKYVLSDNSKMVSVRDYVANKYGIDFEKTDGGVSAEKLAEALDDVTNRAKFERTEEGDQEAMAKELAAAIDKQVNTLFGSDYKNIVSAAKTNSGDWGLTFSKSASTVNISAQVGFDSTLSNLGMPTGGVSSSLSSKTLDEIFAGASLFSGGMGERTIQINDTNITISAKDTISTLTSKINASNAGVTLTYSAASDKFTLESKAEGTAANISFGVGAGADATAELLGALKLGTLVEVEREVATGIDAGNNLTMTTVSGYKLLVGGQSVKLEDTMTDATNKVGTYKEIIKLGTINVGGNDTDIKMKSDGDGGFTIYSDDFSQTIGVTWDNVENKYAYDLAAFGSLPQGVQDQLMALQGKADIALGNSAIGTRSEATNLIAEINGEVFTRQSNTFTYEGMTYSFHSTFNLADESAPFNGDGTINKGTEVPIKIEVNKNTAEIATSIKAFVEEYNKIVDHINGLLTEKRDRDYKPLSDDEKAAMSEEQVKAYEEKARMGLMANDADLRKLLNNMRTAIYQQVEGVGLTMSDIGITTSGNWMEGGRLVVDDTKLNSALESRYDEVVALFTKTSDIPATDMANRGKRTSEIGIAQRLNDILNDAVRTSSVGYSSKGYLVEKAGTLNDASQVQNQISKQLEQYDKKINELLERWYRQENAYYAMFARMETAMSKMQSQQNSLASIMAQQGQ
jgi:flagellar hook-associated protein 2